MLDNQKLKDRLKRLRSHLNSLKDTGASEQDIYVASQELDDCINEYLHLQKFIKV